MYFAFHSIELFKKCLEMFHPLKITRSSSLWFHSLSWMQSLGIACKTAKSLTSLKSLSKPICSECWRRRSFLRCAVALRLTHRLQLIKRKREKNLLTTVSINYDKNGKDWNMSLTQKNDTDKICSISRTLCPIKYLGIWLKQDFDSIVEYNHQNYLRKSRKR